MTKEKSLGQEAAGRELFPELRYAAFALRGGRGGNRAGQTPPSSVVILCAVGVICGWRSLRESMIYSNQ